MKPEAHGLFDFNAVDAWGVNEILKDDIPNLLEKDDLIDYNVEFVPNKQTNASTCIVNKKYFVRFGEDFRRNARVDSDAFREKYDEVVESYKRKSDRFKEILSNEQPVTFLYYEENNADRKVFPEIAARYPGAPVVGGDEVSGDDEGENERTSMSREDYCKQRSCDEIASMKDVMNTIQEKYGKKNIALLYMSDQLVDDVTVDKECKTVYLKVPRKVRETNNLLGPAMLLKTLQKNNEAVAKGLNEMF